MTLRLSVVVAVLAALGFGLLGPAAAQEPRKQSPFAVGTDQTAAPAPGSAAEAGPVTRAWVWITQQQQRLTRDLASAVRAFKTESFWTATGLLAFVSFLYGVFHAAGPGHGKAVISSYALANEKTLWRGVGVSFMAAGVQALSAITIVGVLAILLSATSLQMKQAESWIETISWALVAAIGAWLLYRQLRPWMAAPSNAAQTTGSAHTSAPAQAHGETCCGHDHGDHHTHHHDHHAHGHDHAHAHGHSHAGAGHAADTACCDHAHMPPAASLGGRWSWTEALAMAFAVGIRPCTGAIIVLIFALSQGLLLAGVFATFAMALGTALTVSALAILAVGSRNLAVRWAGGDGRWASRISATAGVAGALLLIGLGSAFFVASLSGPGPL